MNIVYAKNSRNKLEVMDTRPLAIDRIKLEYEGFIVYFVDLKEGHSFAAHYKNREEFNEEWELAAFVYDEPIVKFKDAGRYFD